MASFVSIAKKWPSKMTFKAFVFSFMIVGSFLFVQKTFAFYYQLDSSVSFNGSSEVSGTRHNASPNFIINATTTVNRIQFILGDSNVSGGTYSSRWYILNSSGTANMQCSSVGIYNNSECEMRQSGGTIFPALTTTATLYDISSITSSYTVPIVIPPGTYHIAFERYNSNTGFFKTKGATATSTSMFLQILGVGESLVYPTDSKNTRIYLNTPLDQATSTSPISVSAFYYVNLASSTTGTLGLPTTIEFNIKSSTGSIFSAGKTYTYDTALGEINYDALSLQAHSFSLPDGLYTWSASLVATSTTASTCGGSVFCIFWGNSAEFTTSTTTMFTSEIKTFQIGTGALFSGSGTTTASTTNNAVTFCNQYDGGNYIVTALCFIPNTISSALNAIFIPDPIAVKNDISIIQGDISSLATIFPFGYATRFYSIVSATTTSTSSIPAFTASIRLGPGSSSTPAISTITIDPADMISGASALLATIHDPIDNKSIRDVFQPYVQLSVALTVIMTIVADILGTHKHHVTQESNKKYV